MDYYPVLGVRRRDSVLTPRLCRLCAYVVGRTDQITFTDAVLKMFVAPTVVHWPDSANDYTWFADNPSMDYPTIPWDDHFNAQRREVAKDVSSFKTSRGSKRFMRGGVIYLVPTSVDDSATVDDIENDEPEAYKEATERMMTPDNMENFYALLAGSAIATELQLPQGFLYSGGSPKKARSDFLSADVDTAEGQKFVASVILVSLTIAIFGTKAVEAGRLRKETAFGDEAKSLASIASEALKNENTRSSFDAKIWPYIFNNRVTFYKAEDIYQLACVTVGFVMVILASFAAIISARLYHFVSSMWEKGISLIRACYQTDSRQHRVWGCNFFTDLRAKYKKALIGCKNSLFG